MSEPPSRFSDLTGGAYIELSERNLKKEARQLTEMLKGRTVDVV